MSQENRHPAGLQTDKPFYYYNFFYFLYYVGIIDKSIIPLCSEKEEKKRERPKCDRKAWIRICYVPNNLLKRGKEWKARDFRGCKNLEKQ